MDRLQKKCLIATLACHGLLVGILVFGSALMPNREEPMFNPIKVYSAKDISDALSSGGSPDATVAPPPAAAPTEKTATPPTPPPPAAKPVPPEPVAKIQPPKPVRREEQKPPIEPPKIVRTKRAEPKHEPKEDAKSEDEPPVKTPHKIVIDKDDLKLAVRNRNEKAKQEQEAADAAARAESKRKAQQFAEAYKRIGQDLSPKVQIDMAPGVGTPGELSVNYNDLIVSKYKAAWAVPPNLDDSTPVAVATITIGRDGSVISAHITRASGNTVLDRSVENVLEVVTFIEPFPPSFKEPQRTVTIQFDPKSKRQTG